MSKRPFVIFGIFAIVCLVVLPFWALAKEGTYGALGVAAALLVGLFLISRLAVATAVLNATLSERASAAYGRPTSSR